MNENVDYVIEEQVLTAVRRIIQAVDMHSRQLVRKCGLTGPQVTILREIGRGENVTGARLSGSVRLSQATVTGIVGRLEKKGYVQRERSLGDRRRVLLRITDEGRTALKSAPTPLHERFVERLRSLDDWEASMLLSQLQRTAAMMDADKIEVTPYLTICPTEEKVADNENEVLK